MQCGNLCIRKPSGDCSRALAGALPSAHRVVQGPDPQSRRRWDSRDLPLLRNLGSRAASRRKLCNPESDGFILTSRKKKKQLLHRGCFVYNSARTWVLQHADHKYYQWTQLASYAKLSIQELSRQYRESKPVIYKFYYMEK